MSQRDTSRTASTRCRFPGCTRAVWQDPDGSYSSYCGKTHRDAMAQFRGENLCKKCHSRPVYIQNGRVHDFCGTRCATAYRTGAQVSVSSRASPAPSEGGVCKLAGCRRSAWKDNEGRTSQFCSNRHRREAVQTEKAEGCLFCTLFPKALVNGKQADFCSKTCSLDAINAAPLILQIGKKHSAFSNVEDQFKDNWKHNDVIPQVLQVWKIYGNKAIRDQFARYKLSVERRIGQDGGNTRRRWHGTIRACRLGDDADDPGKRNLCNIRSCSLCQIIRSSFQLARFGERTNFGRFGAGIYTSQTASKADSYVGEVGGSPYRAMLLNEVVLGKPVELLTGDQTLTKPPDGYDSVIGKPGGDLNYDESIVYRNDAICPLFLVIYKP